MHKRRSSGGVLIVVELGAEWPSFSESPKRALAAGRRVLAQEEGEAPAAFGVRVGEQLDGLFACGVPLGTAVIACNERLDEAAGRARAELCRSLLGAMAGQRTGDLLLSASDRNSGRLRHALSALAAELGGEWNRAGLRASVCFEEAASSAASTGQRPIRQASSAPDALAAKDGARQVA